jgi:hypothetical protein
MVRPPLTLIDPFDSEHCILNSSALALWQLRVPLCQSRLTRTAEQTHAAGWLRYKSDLSGGCLPPLTMTVNGRISISAGVAVKQMWE